MSIIEHPIEFMDGVKVLMLIDRGVGSSNKGSRRWINKLISYDRSEFLINLLRLEEQQRVIGDPNVRIYGSINARNPQPAIRDFQVRQVLIQTDEERRHFYKNLNTMFVSCLMKPANRAEKKYLIDMDSKDKSQVSIIRDRYHILHKYETPNGWHFICKPFDVRTIIDLPHCEVKKDALMIWNTL
jgi:hypothetical protein